MANRKLVRADMPSGLHNVWDAYVQFLAAAGPHREALTTVRAFQQLSGTWGQMIGVAANRQAVPPLANLKTCVSRIVQGLGSLDGRLQSALREPLATLTAAIEQAGDD